LSELFLTVLNMSLTASVVIVAIMLARILLKRAPKVISYVLWVVAGFRLVFPFSFESVFSLIPFKTQLIPQTAALREYVSFSSVPPSALLIMLSVMLLKVVLELLLYIWANHQTDTPSSPRHITRKYG